MSQTESPAETHTTADNGSPDSESKTRKGKLAAVAGAGAVAGLAGGIAVAARDSRRRVLGVPLGKRSRLEETASTVVGKVGEPVKKVGSRFSRD
jgi:phosphoribosylcarboxyaminoimidazole (NCAIR) mutase